MEETPRGEKSGNASSLKRGEVGGALPWRRAGPGGTGENAGGSWGEAGKNQGEKPGKTPRGAERNRGEPEGI